MTVAILLSSLALVLLVSVGRADITGSNPSAGQCICLDNYGVNVRNGPCGSVIGSADAPQCYRHAGQKQSCSLSGVTYEFHAVTWGSQTGWMAGNFLVFGNDAQCAGGGVGPGVCSDVEKVSRAEWGARPPSYTIGPLPNKPVGLGFTHHTVTSACTTKDACMAIMRSIQNYHMDTQGWPDIGYNWLVGEDGRAYEGRGWDKLGAHTYGYNDVAVAVSVIGDFTGRNPNTAAQNALRNAFNCAVQQGVLKTNYEMFGHRDGGCTSCPGDSLYALIRTWPEYSFRTIPKYCVADDD